MKSDACAKYRWLQALLIVLLLLPSITAYAQSEPSVGDINDQIDSLNDDVQKKKTSLDEISRKIEEYRAVISQKKAESETLQDQLTLIETNIAKTSLDIDIAKEEISILEMQLKDLDGKIALREGRIVQQRQLLASLSRKLYRTGYRKSVLEILLNYPSFSSFFNALQTIVELQGGVQKAMAKIREESAALADERAARVRKEQDVDSRKRDLEIARAEYEDDKELKSNLLIETKSSELEYRYLVAELKQEQAQANNDIEYLEKSLREKTDIAERLARQETVLSWPVENTRGISSTFHDPEYPFRNVFEHPAIDIRCSQGTPVRAAAAGIVARAKDAGMGYSYVMLMHNNNVSTVYGHLSRIVAKEDSFVERGEIIGYSGGMPGTPGAGKLTTGPHLHFETRIKGFPVDPMEYLTSL